MEPLPPRSPRIARRGEGSALGTMHDILGIVLPALVDAADDDGGADAPLALAALMASMSIVSAASDADDGCGAATLTRPLPVTTVAAVDRRASRRLIASPDNAAARGNTSKRVSGARTSIIMLLKALETK